MVRPVLRSWFSLDGSGMTATPVDLWISLVALLDGKSLRAHDFRGGDWRVLDLMNERAKVEGTRITHP